MDKDYRKELPCSLYSDAAKFGVSNGYGVPTTDMYWAAWFAARRTAGAMLDEAKDMGLSANQWERLRKVASVVAPD